MRPEEILIKAERYGIRIKVLERVSILKEIYPAMLQADLYEMAYKIEKEAYNNKQ